MSGKLLFDAMDCEGLKPAMKLLLVALADRADEAGVCWPSRNDLALRVGLSVSTITRTARWLQSEGWIDFKQRHDTSNLYRLNLLKIERCAAESRARRKLRQAGGEWVPFPEELEAQAIDNKGVAQNDPGSGHGAKASGHGAKASGHGAPLTSQEPLKNLEEPAALSLDLEKVGRFACSEILANRSALVGGVVLKPGTPEFLALSDLLRNGASCDVSL